MPGQILEYVPFDIYSKERGLSPYGDSDVLVVYRDSTPLRTVVVNEYTDRAAELTVTVAFGVEASGEVWRYAVVDESGEARTALTVDDEGAINRVDAPVQPLSVDWDCVICSALCGGLCGLGCAAACIIICGPAIPCTLTCGAICGGLCGGGCVFGCGRYC